MTNQAPSIKSVMHCPACGGEVRVDGSDDGTQYYVPVAPSAVKGNIGNNLMEYLNSEKFDGEAPSATVDIEEPKVLSKEFIDGFERGKAEALRGTYSREDMIAFARYFQTGLSPKKPSDALTQYDTERGK